MCCRNRFDIPDEHTNPSTAGTHRTLRAIVGSYNQRYRGVVILALLAKLVGFAFMLVLPVYFVLAIFVNIEEFLDIKVPLTTAVAEVMMKVVSIRSYIATKQMILEKYGDIIHRLIAEYAVVPSQQGEHAAASQLTTSRWIGYYHQQFAREYAGEPLEAVPPELAEVAASEAEQERQAIAARCGGIRAGQEVTRSLTTVAQEAVLDGVVSLIGIFSGNTSSSSSEDPTGVDGSDSRARRASVASPLVGAISASRARRRSVASPHVSPPVLEPSQSAAQLRAPPTKLPPKADSYGNLTRVISI